MAAKSAYGAAADEVAELFADYLEGDASHPALALSSDGFSPVERDAIDKSLAALGFGSEACTYATLKPLDNAVEGGDVMLDAQALFVLVEGLDPLLLIATDEAAAKLLAESYRASFDLDGATRVNGRSAAVFTDLARLLATPQGKQTAWAAFKSFAH